MNSKKPKRNQVMIEPATVTRQHYDQIIDAIKKFDAKDDKKELYIPVSLYSAHAVYLHVVKTADEQLKVEYVDPFGNKSVYGNPPEGLKRALKSEFGGPSNMIINASSKCQQSTSSSCFAITYQNMIDHFEEKDQSSIKELNNGQEDLDKIIRVRLGMKQDMTWLYDQYNVIKEETLKSSQAQFPKEFADREAAMEAAAKPKIVEGVKEFEPYDPNQHAELLNYEKQKCSEKLSQIDFSKAPSNNPKALSDFPEDLKRFIERQGHKVNLIYSISDPQKIIGYYISLNDKLSPQAKEAAIDAIDNKLPNHISDNTIYVTEKSKPEEKLEHKEDYRPNKI